MKTMRVYMVVLIFRWELYIFLRRPVQFVEHLEILKKKKNFYHGALTLSHVELIEVLC